MGRPGHADKRRGRARTAARRAGRAFSAEFPLFLANHLPMVSVALHRLGADDARLAQFFEIYRVTNHLVPMPPSVAPIERVDLDRRARRPQPRTRLPRVLHRRGRPARHQRRDRRLSADPDRRESRRARRMPSCASLMASCATIPPRSAPRSATGRRCISRSARATGAAPVTDDPGEVLLRLQPVEAFRHVEVGDGPALALHAGDGGKAGVQAGHRLARDRPRHLAAGRRGVARALRRHHGFLRPARADRDALAPPPHGPSCPTPSARSAISGRRSHRSIRRSASPICPPPRR